jgi:hypothetical protein
MDHLDLQERLRELVEAGHEVTVHDLGSGPDLPIALRALAATPIAPLVANALTEAPQDETWPERIKTFVEGLEAQRSQLALVDTCDVLLASPEVVDAAGQLLHDVLLPDAERIMAAPTVAATGLETALRLVLLDAVRRYRVLEALASVPADAPLDYTERLPRLIGIALDSWDNPDDGPHLEATLRRLDASEVEDARWSSPGCNCVGPPCKRMWQSCGRASMRPRKPSRQLLSSTRRGTTLPPTRRSAEQSLHFMTATRHRCTKRPPRRWRRRAT